MSKQHDLLMDLVRLRETEADTKAQLDKTWREVFIMADEIAGVDQPYRYLDGDERMVVGRVMAQGAARLDQNAFLADLTLAEKRTCTRKEVIYTVIPELVEIAARKSPALAAKVTANMTTPPPTPRRFGPSPANKEELAELDTAL